MNQRLDLVEELIDLYTRGQGLAVFITDQKGDLLTPIRGDNALADTLLQKESMVLIHQIQEHLGEITSIERPLLFDLWPGVYTLVGPLRQRGEPKKYVWAGLFVEEHTQSLVKEHLGQQNTFMEIDLNEALAQTPVLYPEKKEQLYQWMNKLLTVIDFAFRSSMGKNIQMLEHPYLFEVLRDHHAGLDEALHHFQQGNRTFDFLGVAEKEGDEVYQVNWMAGSNKLIGTRFFLGEGFLGRALVTCKHAFWEEVDRDPRAIFLKRHQFHVKSLFGFPIKQFDGSYALFFGGNFSEGLVGEEEKELAKIMAIILERNLQTNAFKQEYSQQLQRLTSLVEVCRLMASIPDYKRILYLLVDISLGLLDGSFASIVINDSKSGKMQLVSRGSEREQISTYARDVINRYFSKAHKVPLDVSVRYEDDHTMWDFPVIECPLYYNDTLLGVLCVGILNVPEKEVHDHLQFLEALAIMGGVSLQMARQEHVNIEDEKVCSLHQAIEQFDQEAYHTTAEAAKIAGDFAGNQGLPLPTVKEIIQACQLSFYDVMFIEENLKSEQVNTIIKEGKQLMEHCETTTTTKSDMEAQLFALAVTYAQYRSIDQLTELQVNKQVLSDFKMFIYESQVMEEEIAITEEIIGNEELLTVTDTIKELKLSSREQEVLDLIVQGMTNKEIAESLFISDHTVKNHVTKIFQKLHVTDRAHAISKVYQIKYGVS